MTPVDKRSFRNITTEVIHFYTLVIEWATEAGEICTGLPKFKQIIVSDQELGSMCSIK